MLQAVLGEVIAWRRRFGRFLDLRDRGRKCLLKSPGYLGTDPHLHERKQVG